MAVADDGGGVTVFDLGTGKRVASSRLDRTDRTTSLSLDHPYAVSYSPCGSCLAVGTGRGVDLRDARTIGGGGGFSSVVERVPSGGVPVMDLVWTRANALLAGGIV